MNYNLRVFSKTYINEHFKNDMFQIKMFIKFKHTFIDLNLSVNIKTENK